MYAQSFLTRFQVKYGRAAQKRRVDDTFLRGSERCEGAGLFPRTE